MKNLNSFDALYYESLQEGKLSQAIKNAALAATLATGSIETADAASNNTYIQDLIRHEGTISYQKHTGSFKNGKFYPYKDRHGQSIGYGHFIKPGENFENGITPEQALGLLKLDSEQAKQHARDLFKSANAPSNPEVIDIIAQMTFQLGKQGVKGFKNMWVALAKGDYETASKEMLDSDWARKQTPKRANELAQKMRALQ